MFPQHDNVTRSLIFCSCTLTVLVSHQNNAFFRDIKDITFKKLPTAAGTQQVDCQGIERPRLQNIHRKIKTKKGI